MASRNEPLLKRLVRIEKFQINPLPPNCKCYLISVYSMTKEIIANWRSSWLFDKFFLTMQQKMCRENFWRISLLMLGCRKRFCLKNTSEFFTFLIYSRYTQTHKNLPYRLILIKTTKAFCLDNELLVMCEETLLWAYSAQCKLSLHMNYTDCIISNNNWTVFINALLMRAFRHEFVLT